MSRLTNLMGYYRASRRVGHTTFMIEGVNFQRPALFLFASRGHAQDAFRQTLERMELGSIEHAKPDFARLRIGKVSFQTTSILDNIEGLVRGHQQYQLPPIVIDHYALQVLIAEHEREMNKLVGRV